MALGVCGSFLERYICPERRRNTYVYACLAFIVFRRKIGTPDANKKRAPLLKTSGKLLAIGDLVVRNDIGLCRKSFTVECRFLPPLSSPPFPPRNSVWRFKSEGKYSIQYSLGKSEIITSH